MADFPNIAATSFGNPLPVTLDQNAVSPYVGQGAVIGSVGAAAGPSWGNLSAEQLASVIAYQNARLSQLDIPTMQGNLAVQNRQLDQNASQFDRQLFFNEQAQRAAELQAYRALEFNKQQLAQTAQTAERARQTQQLQVNYDAAIRATQAARDEALQRQQIAASSYGQAAAVDQAARAQAAANYGQAAGIEGAGLDRAMGGYGQAAGASLGLQNLAASSYGQAESLRQGLIDKALQTANLIASLRGSSNAFKQLEVNGYLAGSGAGSLLGALSGAAGVPAYRGLGGTPEAATLGTMARDAGAIPTVQGPDGVFRPDPRYVSPGFGDSAGIQGLLGVAGSAAGGMSPDVAALRGLADRAALPSGDAAALRGLAAQQATGGADAAGLRALAAQNAPYTPTDPATGQASRTYADMLDQIAWDNITAGQAVLGPDYGPNSTVGAKLTQGYQELIAGLGVSYLGADDPHLVNLYRSVVPSLSETQARMLTHYAEDYYRTYGTAIAGKQLNEMVGQVMAGQPPDLTKWTDGAKALIPGWGTPAFKAPPAAWTPGTAPPATGQPPAGQPPAGAEGNPQPVTPIAPPPVAPAPPPGQPAPGGPAVVPQPAPAQPAPLGPPNAANPSFVPGVSPPADSAGTNAPGGAVPPNTVPPGYPQPTAPRPAAPVGVGAAGTTTVTPKGWKSPEGYDAVVLSNGTAGYRLPNGQVIDGQGRVLLPASALGQPAAPAAAPPAAPAPTGFVAPGGGGTSAAQPTPAAAAKPTTTYKFDYLPGGRGLGYLGTDGKMFSSSWDPIT